jgi:hypothetical protein
VNFCYLIRPDILEIIRDFFIDLIGRAVIDKKLMPFGLSILRCLSLPNPVSPDPDSYSLSESLLESLERFFRFCTEGLAILVIMATLACIVGQVGAAVSLAQLAKLLDAHLLWDLIRRACLMRLSSASPFQDGL